MVGSCSAVNFAVSKELDLLFDWTSTRSSAKAAEDQRIITQPNAQGWQKPPGGSNKCNVDTTIFVPENKYGIGMIVRTDTSEFYRGMTMWFNRVPTRGSLASSSLVEGLGIFIYLRRAGLFTGG